MKQILYKMNGQFIGVKYNDRFYSYDGVNIGVFKDNGELFNFEGVYIGELLDKTDRLLFKKSHSNHRGPLVAKSINHLSMSIVNITRRTIPIGCKDVHF